jgi:drug/metabolite transporter (DMT)-like permease
MTTRAWIAFLALCVIWGIPYFFIKQAVAELSPACIAFGRVALGAALLLPIAWHRGGFRNLGAHKGPLLAFAIAELVGTFFLIAYGERAISSSLAGTMLAAVPLMVVMIGPTMGIREKLGSRRLLGLVVGLVGVVTLLGVDTVHGSEEWVGAGCVLIAAIGYAIGPLIIQRHMGDTDPLGATAVSLALGAVILFVPALLTAPTSLPSSTAIVAVAVLGIVCTALGLVTFVFLIREATASRATIITYVNPAIAVLLGVLILDERFGVGAMAGMVLILIGSWLATGKAAAHP